MDLRARIRRALADAPLGLTTPQLVRECGADRNELDRMLGQLLKAGFVKSAGMRDGLPVRALADWPAPPPGDEAEDHDTAPITTSTAPQEPSPPPPPPLATEPAAAVEPAPKTPAEAPTTTAAPHAAHHQGNTMPTEEDRILAALKKAPEGLPRAELTKDREDAEDALDALLAAGTVRRTGAGRGTRYTLPPAFTNFAVCAKPPRARTLEAEPPTPAPPADEADFAITAEGLFTIRKHDQLVPLHAREFQKLRDFIERTRSVWEAA